MARKKLTVKPRRKLADALRARFEALVSSAGPAKEDTEEAPAAPAVAPEM